MITTRYVWQKTPPPMVDLARVIDEYHQILERLRNEHNLKFAPYRPWREENNPKVNNLHRRR
jgi:hypothetical protein